MRSLFLRIFLSFWIIQWILLGVTIFQMANRSLNVSNRFTQRVRGSVETAAELAILRKRTNGLPGYMQSLERFHRASNIELWVTDAQGHELANRDIPEDTLKQLHRSDLKVRFFVDEVPYTAYAEVPMSILPPFRGREDLERMLISIALSGLISFWLARYLTLPIDNLRRAAQQLAEGDLSARANPSNSKDQIGQLVNDFNAMADRLQANVVAQKQMVSDISHELRSPLARLTVALDIARGKAGPDAASALARIELESQRLNEMIGRILSLAQLSSGEFHLQKSEIEVSDLVREIVADADFEARAKGTSVNVRIAPQTEDATVQGYPALLRSAVENVVRNAIAYTTPGTSIDIEQSESAGMLQIIVRDHGSGVPDEALPHLFLPFYRVDNSRTRRTGGTGLGLAIAAKSIALHGGTIQATNASDQGLIVTIRLSANQMPAPQREAVTV